MCDYTTNRYTEEKLHGTLGPHASRVDTPVPVSHLALTDSIDQQLSEQRIRGNRTRQLKRVHETTAMSVLFKNIIIHEYNTQVLSEAWEVYGSY